MSSVIGALRVNLGLDSAQFRRGMSQAQKDLATARKNFMAMSAVAVAAFGAVTAAALRGADGIDQAAKSARRIDSSIGGFRALELAAGEAGVAVSTLADAVQTMDREIAKGSKGASDALQTLNLTAQQLEGLDADQKMALIADSIQDLGLSTAQTSVILQQLGIRNRDMVLALGAGGQIFREARRDVDDYGLAISKVDSDAIEKANDLLGRLGLISQYAGQQLAIALVPAMGAMAQAMTDSLREGGLLRTLIDGLANNLDILAVATGAVVTAMGLKVIALRAATGGLGLFTAAVNLARGALAALLGPMGLVYIAIGAGAAAWIAHRAATNDSKTAMNSAESAAKDLSIELTAMAGTDLPNASRATVQLANDNLALARSAYAAAQAQVELAKATQQAAFTQSSVEDAFLPGVENPGRAAYEAANAGLMASVEALKAAEAELNNRVFEGNTVKTEAAEVVERLRGEVSDLEDEVSGGGGGSRGLTPAMEKLDLTLKDVDNTAEQWASNMAGHFDGLITGGMGLSGVLMSIARQLESTAWQQLFSGMGGGGGNFFTKALGFLGGGGGGSGVLVPQNVLAAAASFSGGGYTGNGPRSGGLDGQGGFMAMMHPRETVIDHTKGQGAGGGSRTVVELRMSPDVEARVLERSASQSVEITREGLRQFSGEPLTQAMRSNSLDPRMVRS